MSFSGAITGTGGLTKLGASTLTLSGVNSYSGPTLVSAGTLKRVFMPYIGGFGAYRRHCDEVAANRLRGAGIDHPMTMSKRK